MADEGETGGWIGMSREGGERWIVARFGLRGMRMVTGTEMSGVPR